MIKSYKPICFLTSLFFIIFLLWKPVKADDNNVTYTIHSVEEDRIFEIHIPPTYNKITPIPLVIAFHGGGGDIKAMRDSTLLNNKADSANFMVVYPNSQSGYHKWNVGHRENPKDQAPGDDVAFIKAMLDLIASKYNIDSNRIFATGISNGGMMTYRVACDLSNRIAAIAPVATTLMFHECNPLRPVPVLHIHGTADRFIPYLGGPSSDSLPKLVRVKDNMRSVDATTSFWRKENKCGDESKIIYKHGSVICKAYSPCAENSEVIICTVEGGGHTWPGEVCAAKSKLVCKTYYKLVGLVSNDITTNDVIWEFFKKHLKITERKK